MNSGASPVALLEIAMAYQRSRVLFALVELRIPEMLAAGPRSRVEISSRLGADPVAADRFLDACVAIGLLLREGDAFRNASETQRFLVPGAPDDLVEVFRHAERMSHAAAWTGFAQRLRTWRAGAGDRLSLEGVPVGGELLGQHRLALQTGAALGHAIDLSAHRCLLDLGGGTGAMSIALCRSFPALSAIVLERSAVAAHARWFVAESGLADRIEVREGDFVENPLPAGCDAVLLANVLSMSSAPTNRALLGRAFDLLPAGGVVILSGWMLDDDRTTPVVPVLFCLEDIALGAPDVERSMSTYAGWLTDAGFEDLRQSRYFDPVGLVSGRKR